MSVIVCMCHVAGIQYKMERSWILSMIADGLREHLDYKICEKRFAVKILLTFYDSPLADNQTQVITVLKVSCCNYGSYRQ